MFKKILKKIALAATLVCMTFAVTASSACNVETDHPTVRITIEFNAKKYNLDYTLYRNMYPGTVRHFIELAENGFYNGMLVHDYDSGDWFTGGFDYVEDDYKALNNNEGFMTEYLFTHSKEQEYLDLFDGGKLTPTVFREDNEAALPTLVGEFSENNSPEIKNGARIAEAGALKMFYYEKDVNDKALVDFDDPKGLFRQDYRYNCATSIFSIQVGSSTYREDKYCVFATINNLSTLNDLIDDIAKYFEDQDIDAISANGVPVDRLVEQLLDLDTEANFTLPGTPIIIRSVTVTGY